MPGTSLTPIDEIQRVDAVSTILEAVAAMTGLRFVCVAHVTGESWTACAVLDRLGFGLEVGGSLDVTTTLCEDVRDTRSPVVIDNVEHDEIYCQHPTPRMYGFQSYISVPIFRRDGDYFGTLCGLDTEAADLSRTEIVAGLQAFSRLISLQLENESSLVETQTALLNERETSELREQFIAVLGHDLRTPLSAIMTGLEVLGMQVDDPLQKPLLQRIMRSARRISTLIDDVLDFTRGRMGGGISLDTRLEPALQLVFEQVIAELQDTYPTRRIDANIQQDLSLRCDPARLGQLLSNLLKNALVHGASDQPVIVTAEQDDSFFRLSVANGGPRLPEEVLEKLFKPFWRGAPEAAREGLGLGLFIVSEITRSHGATMDVQSNAEQTTFAFTMPLSEIRVDT